MANKTIRKFILATVDILSIFVASILTYFFLDPYVLLTSTFLTAVILIMSIVYLLLAFSMGVFSRVNRYTSIRETLIHIGVVCLTTIISLLVSFIVFPTISLRFFLMSFLVMVVLIPGSRVLWRIMFEHNNKLYQHRDSSDTQRPLRTLVIGAGDGGALLVRRMKKQADINFVGMVDDDPSKVNRSVYGIKVLGTTKDIDQIVKDKDVDQITLAIPSLTADQLDRIVTISSNAGVQINQMPSVENILSGELTQDTLREIEVSDLLGREEVELDLESIKEQVFGKTILITGAGGSIGSEIARQILKFRPKRTLLLGHGENSIYLINRELNQIKNEDTEIIPLIADIQDRNRIFYLLDKFKPDRVYHAAAHKHVPMMEANPTEAIKNNVYGTKNVAEAAKAAGVTAFVMVSTDKAVNPPNVMGASKRIAELIVTGLNETGKTQFVAVRFGNVLNSRGSVVPVFKEQIKKGGPITVTDFRMTRYFMTIPEASRLVLQAGSLAKGGEIFVLDMGNPVKIYDLARKMVHLSGKTEREIEIVESGIRPGEKLYEELLSSGERVSEQVYDKIFVGNVKTLPIDQVLSFVESLNTLPEDEFKENVVKFANENN